MTERRVLSPLVSVKACFISGATIITSKTKQMCAQSIVTIGPRLLNLSRNNAAKIHTHTHSEREGERERERERERESAHATYALIH